jgi:hypothetical protein
MWAIVALCSLPWWPGLVPAIADKVREPRVRAGNTRVAMVVSNELQKSTLGRPLLFEARGIRHQADRRCRNQLGADSLLASLLAGRLRKRH